MLPDFSKDLHFVKRWLVSRMRGKARSKELQNSFLVEGSGARNFEYMDAKSAKSNIKNDQNLFGNHGPKYIQNVHKR